MSKLSKIIKEKHGLDYSQEIAELIFDTDLLIKKLEKNKLYKEDRDNLILLLNILKLGEY